MKKQKAHMDESILVCAYYGPNGERLIRRGGKLASMLNCPLYILTVDSMPIEEMDAEKRYYIDRWRELAKELNAEYIVIDNEKRPVVKVIADVVREKKITQVIIGQTARSRWQEITKGYFANGLLKEVPFIDLHIISVSRALENMEGHFEKGVRAYLIKDGDGYALTFNHTKDVVFEGIFYKELGTDFDNGVFRFMHNNEVMQVQVVDDYVKELKNIHVIDEESINKELKEASF